MTPSSDGQMEPRRVLSTQQRKSSHAACVDCHSRKVRCDAHKRGFPCSNCISSRRPHCRVHEKKKRTPHRPVENPVPIRPQTQESHLENSGSTTGLASSIHCTTSSSLSSPVPEANATPGSAATESDRSGFRRHLVEFLDQADIGHRSIQKGVRITYVGKDVSNINFLVRQREGREDETVHHFPSDEIARQYITHEPERMPREAFILPEKAVADELVEAYFTNINPGCPIVDEDIFMAQYINKNPSDPPSLLVLQAILLVGAHVSRHRPDRETLKATFFRRAKMLFDARLEKNRDVVVQAALLLTWHSDGAEDIGAGAWYWTGIAARIATGLGMHRDAGSSTLINHDLRTWRRTWWILVQFDVMVSLSHGRPQAINLDECDVKSLTASDFQGCGPRVNIDFVVKYTELCLLISKALKERFGLRVSREERKAALGNADEALANWCLSLPPSLQMRSSDMDVWSATLHLSYNNFLILLHRPHPKASQRSNDYGPNDGDICSSAANTVATIFEDLREKDRIKYLWISDVNALFTAMIQVSVELRFSNPVLAINALRRFDSTLCSLRKLAEYWINAESILRIFEESSQIQHVARLGKGPKNCGDLQPARERSESRSGSRNQQRTAMLNQPTIRFDSASITLQTHLAQTWAGEEQSDLDVLAAAANAASDLSGGQMQQPQAGDEQNDWGHFISTNISEPNQILLSPDIMHLDNEWREIYWQEPGIPGSFGDGLFGW